MVPCGFAHTDRGIALAGAGTIGTELKVELYFASCAEDDGDSNVGLIRRDALPVLNQIITSATCELLQTNNMSSITHVSEREKVWFYVPL